MARAIEESLHSVDDAQSRFGITIDLTDSGEFEDTAGSSPLRDGRLLRTAAAGPGVPPHSIDGIETWRHSPPGSSVDAVPLPGFILGKRSMESAGPKVLAAVQRGFDLVLAGLLLFVLTPLMIVAATAVKLDSPGPIFYRHRRCGRHGRKVGVLKFRSMVVDADRKVEEARREVLARNGTTVDAPTFKSADDPRITRVGRFLRRSGIDEIPQLLNVIAGHMSIVGPRPLVEDEVAMLSPEEANLRHSVRPGITCLWQVFRTEATSFSERMQLDLLYVRQRSLRLYLTLVVITPLALFRGRGAY